MTPRESDITPLDPRFPISMSMPASCFWEMAHLRPDRAALSGLTGRARADEAAHLERFVTPAPPGPRWVPALPALAHEDTSVDMPILTLHDGDRFPREDTPRHGGWEADTDRFLIRYDQAAAREQAKAQRSAGHRIRRAIRQQLLAITRAGHDA